MADIKQKTVASWVREQLKNNNIKAKVSSGAVEDGGMGTHISIINVSFADVESNRLNSAFVLSIEENMPHYTEGFRIRCRTSIQKY